MGYDVQIIADSVSPSGVRLTTMIATYPRFIHSELMTHRMFSRNAASSRAIPVEKNIERVNNDPFVPQTFNKRVKGMGVGDQLEGEAQKVSREAWLFARDKAVVAAEILIDQDVDKSRVNRLLEPFVWMTTIFSATEWSNFFALRCHPDAQPEMQKIAYMMRSAMEESEPLTIRYGEWHLPLTSSDFPFDGPIDWEYWAMVSAGRCARVSFDTHDNYEEPAKSVERAERLKSSGHMSPLEHCARPVDDNGKAGDPDFGMWGREWTEFVGNFRGWVQLRKTIQHESDFGQLIETTK